MIMHKPNIWLIWSAFCFSWQLWPLDAYLVNYSQITTTKRKRLDYLSINPKNKEKKHDIQCYKLGLI